MEKVRTTCDASPVQCDTCLRHLIAVLTPKRIEDWLNSAPVGCFVVSASFVLDFLCEISARVRMRAILALLQQRA